MKTITMLVIVALVLVASASAQTSTQKTPVLLAPGGAIPTCQCDTVLEPNYCGCPCYCKGFWDCLCCVTGACAPYAMPADVKQLAAAGDPRGQAAMCGRGVTKHEDGSITLSADAVQRLRDLIEREAAKEAAKAKENK